MNKCILKFNGEHLDPVSGTTHLGNGYRAYSPVLMRFNCSDDWSPFNLGGINSYAYCVGDPVSRADPSGHMSLGQSIGIGVGLMAGIVFSIMTEGAAMPAVLSLMTTVAGDAIIGAGTEPLSEVIDKQRVSWGQVGMAAGVSAAIALAGYGVAIGVRSIASKVDSIIHAGEGSINTWGSNNIHHVLTFGYRDSWREGNIHMAYAFKDYKGLRIKPRLTIVAHGGYITEQSTGGIYLENTHSVYHGDQFAREMRNVGYNFDNYSSVRAVVCNTGDGGETSFAAKFSREAGLPVTGFQGLVSSRDALSSVIQGLFYDSRISGFSEISSFRRVNNFVNNSIDEYRARIALLQIDSPVFRVLKQGHLYRPVTWFPDGTYANINY